MIRRQEQDDFLLITQHDHALIAGELAEYFGNEFFEAPQPLESALAGIRLHDCGWPLHDNEPTRNKDGLPLDVFETPREIGLKVWNASVDGATAKDPYAGLLVSLHVLSLSVFATTQTNFEHEKWDLDNPQDRFAVTKFQQSQIQKQDHLRLKLGLRSDKTMHHSGPPQEGAQKKEDQLNFNFRLLQAMDVISLGLCCTKPPSKQTQDVFSHPGAAPLRLNLTRNEKDLIVDPWPFNREVIELMIPTCRISARAYESDDELRAAVKDGASEVLTSRVLPAHLP